MKTTNRELRTALIGAGKMGMNHLHEIHSLSGNEIVGIADSALSPNHPINLKYPNIKVYNDAEKLLHELKPDVVHIVTPPSTHSALAKVALSNNCHIYLEKPFTLTLSEAKDIIDLANQKKLKVCAGHQLLCQEAFKKVRNSAPLIGELTHIESYFSFRTVRKSISPVDQLIDILPHPLYTLLFFMDSREGSEIEIKGVHSDTDGNLHLLLRSPKTRATLIVTLQGRPVDSYLKLVGKFGTLVVDFVRDIVIELTGSGADAISAISQPYRRSHQEFWKSTGAFFKMATGGRKGYPGLSQLISEFYDSIRHNTANPVSSDNILGTVRITEICRNELYRQLKAEEKEYQKKLDKETENLPDDNHQFGKLLVTGGTGFLGKTVTEHLQNKGWSVRVLSRSKPSMRHRIAGVDYVTGDISKDLPVEIFNDVFCVIHCAAETAGGQADHERNSIQGTRNLIEIAAKHRIEKFIHISSIAVLKSSKELGRPIDENSPIDSDNLGRGPYVWGKAQSEIIAKDLVEKNKMDLKIIRPGPLVDFNNFEAPGRLGREVGKRFIVMGSRNSKISVCDVHSVAKTIEYYLRNFKEAPPVLNLIETNSITRVTLLNKLIEFRKDLKGFFIPSWLVKLMSITLVFIQKIIHPRQQAINVYAAFASESYDSTLADKILEKVDVRNK